MIVIFLLSFYRSKLPRIGGTTLTNLKTAKGTRTKESCRVSIRNTEVGRLTIDDNNSSLWLLLTAEIEN